MSILNDKLEKIISESGINFYKDEIGNELRSKYKLIELSEVIQKIWDNLPDNANIAIYGLGTDSRHLFDSVDLTKKNVVCMIDNNPKLTDFKGYPVIRCEDIPAHKIDIVIVTSHLYADEMIASVEAVSPDCVAIYMWEKLGTIGCIFRRSWLRLFGEEFFYSAFLLKSAVLFYNEAHDFRYLLYVINKYLEFKDLKTALVFIDKYISSKYPDFKKMLALKNNLLDLLGEIKQKLSENRNPHTLVLISDAMRASDVTACSTPFLHELGQSNIRCPNAYSHVGWTSASLSSMFKQKSFIDNRLYKEPILSGTEPFFEYLSKNNIEFAYYWSYDSKSIFENISEKVTICQKGCADTIWQYLCSSFENDKRTLIFLHFMETHSPGICISGLSLFYLDKNYYLDCVKYIDAQVEFLFGLLPNSARLLFCSDHGGGISKRMRDSPIAYWNKRYNIPYIICDRKTYIETDGRLVSHLDTVDILINLLNDRPAFENIESRLLVETNEEFICSEEILASTARLYGNIKAFCAHKSFITKTDKYVISYDGEEGYFLLPDDDGINLIDDPKYADRINWFRQNVNTEFPDFSDDNGRYDATRKYFDVDKKNTRK